MTSSASQQSSTMRQATRRIFQTADNSLALIGHLVGHVDTLIESVGRDSQKVAADSRALAQALTSQFDVARRGLQASPKALKVARVLLALALRYRIEEGRSSTSSGKHQDRLQALHESGAHTLRELCIETRGTFLKLGQFLSMRPDLLPSAYIRELATLRDKVPALPYEVVQAAVEAELGKSMEELFATFDREPVAAASLAQVHRATDHKGRHCAVKVQLPQAADEVHTDIALLTALAGVISDRALFFDLTGTLEQLSASILAELDYHQEAIHCQRLAERIGHTPGLELPTVVPELSCERVLTMSWMPGASLSDALAAMESAQKSRVLNTLVRSFADQIFVHGYFHADPHAGNFLVQDEGSLVMLDFGCVAVLSDPVRRAYADLMTALFMGDSEGLGTQLAILGFSAGKNQGALETLVRTMLDMLAREDALAQWAQDPQAAIKALLTASKAVPGIITPRHFVLLGRVLATLGGLLIEHADAKVSLPTILAASLISAKQRDQASR